jgi:hypothetical protein
MVRTDMKIQHMMVSTDVKIHDCYKHMMVRTDMKIQHMMVSTDVKIHDWHILLSCALVIRYLQSENGTFCVETCTTLIYCNEEAACCADC